MSEMKGVETIVTSEFKIKPKTKHDYLIDGDPYSTAPVHVKVLPKSLMLFAEDTPGVEMITREKITMTRRGSLFCGLCAESEAAGESGTAESGVTIPLEGISEEDEYEQYSDDEVTSEMPEAVVKEVPKKHHSFLHKIKWPKHITNSKHHRERSQLLVDAKVRCSSLDQVRSHTTQKLGEELKAKNAPERLIKVIYNPVSGKGYDAML